MKNLDQNQVIRVVVRRNQKIQKILVIQNNIPLLQIKN